MQVFQAEKEKAQPLTSSPWAGKQLGYEVYVDFIIRFLYLLSRFLRFHDQVFVRANWNLSGLCTEKAESVIRVMYGQDENCATATGCGTIYYGTITFDPSPSAIFIVSKTAIFPLICCLLLRVLLYCPTISRIHCIKYRYLGFVWFDSLVQCIRGCKLMLPNRCMGPSYTATIFS